MVFKPMSRRLNKRPRGFTLLEVTIMIIVIATLASIVIIRFSDAITKSHEGATKASLGSIRSALTFYYNATEGVYPSDLGILTIGGAYLKTIPTARNTFHDPSASVLLTASLSSDDAGGWLYVNAGGGNQGIIWDNCTHTDTKGSAWTNY